MRVSSAFFILAQLQHGHDLIARDEDHAGVVGHHQIARIDADVAHLDFAVDLDGFKPPLAGDRRDLARPDRIIDRTRVPHVAHTTHDDGAALALALAGERRDAAHVRHAGDARDHQQSPSSARICASNSAMPLRFS